MGRVRRFEFRYDRWCGWLLGAVGMGRRHSRITVERVHARVVMGWAFRATILRSSIRTVAAADARVWGWGVHGWRGRWLVNGSSQGLVDLTIDPPARGRVIGVPVRLRELRVSVTEPEQLIAELSR